MIEPIMYLAIGFSGLDAVRADDWCRWCTTGRLRLTTRRMERRRRCRWRDPGRQGSAARGIRDSARRLEMSVDQLKNKTTSQLAELGKKSDAIKSHEDRASAKRTPRSFSLEAREKAMKEQLRATKRNSPPRRNRCAPPKRRSGISKADLAKLSAELSDRSMMAESRQVELVAVRTQIVDLRAALATPKGIRHNPCAARTAARRNPMAATRELWRGAQPRRKSEPAWSPISIAS